MVWKIPMIAVLLSAGEISAVCIFQKNKELQGERERHFAEEQQVKAMKRRLEEAENFYGSIRKVRHEMKSHMANIKGLVAGKNTERWRGTLTNWMRPCRSWIISSAREMQ